MYVPKLIPNLFKKTIKIIGLKKLKSILPLLFNLLNGKLFPRKHFDIP